jgi:hypothetical protein
MLMHVIVLVSLPEAAQDYQYDQLLNNLNDLLVNVSSGQKLGSNPEC